MTNQIPWKSAMFKASRFQKKHLTKILLQHYLVVAAGTFYMLQACMLANVLGKPGSGYKSFRVTLHFLLMKLDWKKFPLP